MDTTAIFRAWAVLVALSACTALLTRVAPDGAFNIAVAAAILALAGAKSRLILGHYLELKQSRFWMRTFDLILGLLLVLAFLIFAFGSAGRA